MYSPIQSQITPAADYVVGKAMRVDGVDFRPGEPLPADSPLRQMPKRLRQLCGQRRLIPGKPAEKLAEKSAASPASPKAQKEDLDKLSIGKLKEHCLDYGLSISGSKIALRNRLRAHLG